MLGRDDINPNEMPFTKQVIVVRKDLNMRTGKIAAQVAHASLNSVLDLMHYSQRKMGRVLSLRETDPMCDWLDGELMTKIVVGVNSEEELFAIQEKAKEAGVRTSLVQDAGKTEFNGVPTYTCLAVGPNVPDKIDEITGKLELI